MSESSPSRGPERSNGSPGDTARSGRILDRLKSLLRLSAAGSGQRDELVEIIDDRAEDQTPIDPGELELIRNILTLRDVTVADAMVPRADIIALDIDTPFARVVATMADAAHSRLPVYRETLDGVIGMLHIKDLLTAMRTEAPPPLDSLVRPVLFVPPSLRALDLLKQMRESRTHLALVVDEYGGIDGLVTIEDLVEQIVGEIEDEHDDTEEQPPIQVEADGVLLIDARTPLEDVAIYLGPVLDDAPIEDIDTLGGLVVSLAGRVPAAGETITHASGLSFDIVASDGRRVQSVRLRPASGAEQPDEDAIGSAVPGMDRSAPPAA